MRTLIKINILVLVYLFSISCSNSSSSEEIDTLNNGLIAYYSFELSVDDKMDFKLNGINHSCGYVDAVIGKGINLNGINSWVEIPHDSMFNSDEKSIHFWFYKSNEFIQDTFRDADLEGLIFKTFDTGDQRDFSFLVANQAPPFDLSFQTISQDTSFYAKQSNSIHPYKWYHIVGIINENEISLYINGDLVDKMSFAGSLINTSAPIVIGKASYTSKPTRYFNGIIDELRIYNRTLSINEITKLYNLR